MAHYRYLVKTIQKRESVAWVTKLPYGKHVLPVRTAQTYDAVIVIHRDHALVMKVASITKAKQAYTRCGPNRTTPVRSTLLIRFQRRGARWLRAVVPGFRGIRYTNTLSHYAR